jgi:hypothetical protein
MVNWFPVVICDVFDYHVINVSERINEATTGDQFKFTVSIMTMLNDSFHRVHALCWTVVSLLALTTSNPDIPNFD